MGRMALISDPRVTNIPVRECGQGLIDVSLSLCVRISSKRKDSNPLYALVRTEVAERLLMAQQALPSGFNLCLEEGLRAMSVQKKIFDDYLCSLRKRHSGCSERTLQELACMYAAKPEGIPPHSTGGAVDVTLVSDKDEEYDFGSNSDETPLENSTRNFTRCRTISPGAKENRLLLAQAMSRAGFVNYPAEWWHWSYGDQYWVYRKSRRHALYGPASALG
jgi:zinc D-Ala-D-Ala dipeptidase